MALIRCPECGNQADNVICSRKSKFTGKGGSIGKQSRYIAMHFGGPSAFERVRGE